MTYNVEQKLLFSTPTKLRTEVIKDMTNHKFNNGVFLEIKKAIHGQHNIPKCKENYLIEKRAPGFDWSYAFLIAAIVGSGAAGAVLIAAAFTFCPSVGLLVGVVTLPAVTAWSVTAASAVCGVAAFGAWGFFLNKAINPGHKDRNEKVEYIDLDDYESSKLQ
jgi:hypothetical protein